MDKRVDGLAGALCEIAEQRDNQLRDAVAISAERLKQLQAFLAVELPVETALFAAARHRDKSLSLPEPALPGLLHATLIEQVRMVRAKTKAFDGLRRVAAWMRVPSWPEPYRTALIAAVAVVGTSAVLHFSRPGNAGPAQISSALPSFITNPDAAAFPSDNARLSLRVRPVELASLDPSLFTIKGALPRFDQSNAALPLDLPTRQIRLDVEALRMP